jgi:hypothetical protein
MCHSGKPGLATVVTQTGPNTSKCVGTAAGNSRPLTVIGRQTGPQLRMDAWLLHTGSLTPPMTIQVSSNLPKCLDLDVLGAYTLMLTPCLPSPAAP